MKVLSEARSLKPSGFVALKGVRKICVVTAYDYFSAQLAEKAGVDAVLIGDSASMVMLGYKDTIPISLDEMLTFCKAVSNGAPRSFLLADMPFLSYQVSVDSAIINAGKFLQIGGVGAVKIEGGAEYAPLVEKMVVAGIPVMGHVGLKPQSAALWSGYRRQGRTAEEAEKILRDAEALEDAGVFSIVLEMIPREVAKLVTEEVKVPTIGIGSGSECDGQVLVWHDMLGLSENQFKFVKRYSNLRDEIVKALAAYRSEVLQNRFPSEENSFQMEKNEFEKLITKIRRGQKSKRH